MHGIAYNEVHDEFYIPTPLSQAILTFRGAANGEEAPIRVIQGPLTQLDEPQRLAIDPVHNEIVIAQDRNVLVFRRDANGNEAPLRKLTGRDLRPYGAAVDTVRNLLVIPSESTGSGPDRGKFLIFDRTASGEAKPLRVIGGDKSMISRFSGPMAVYPPTGKIIAGMRGETGAELATDECFVGVWNITDNGDVPPHYTIGGPKGVLQMVRGVALNAKHKELIVTDKRLNAVLTFYFPEIF